MALSPTEKPIRRCLERLRDQLLRGDDSQILCWPLPDHLACSQRPLRDHPVFAPRIPGQRPPPLPPEARPLVEKWVDRVIGEGVNSIICLLEPAQLDRYYVRGGLDLPGGGLLEYYKFRKLNAVHIALTDYQRPSVVEMENVWKRFQSLRHPVLLHCSAGIDRTTPVAGFLVDRFVRVGAG